MNTISRRDLILTYKNKNMIRKYTKIILIIVSYAPFFYNYNIRNKINIQ